MKSIWAIAALLMLAGAMLGQNVSTMPAYQIQPELLNPCTPSKPCLITCTRPNGCITHLPEPMDVPAIEKTGWCDNGTWRDDWPPTTPIRNANVGNGCSGSPKRWTCDDTRRVLLTSENGVRHCILF